MQHAERGAVLLSLMERLRDHGGWCGATDIQKTV